MDEIFYRVTYSNGYRNRTLEVLEERQIQGIPAKGNKNSFLVELTPGRADELKGLEGIGSVLPITPSERTDFIA